MCVCVCVCVSVCVCMHVFVSLDSTQAESTVLGGCQCFDYVTIRPSVFIVVGIPYYTIAWGMMKNVISFVRYS